MIFKIGVNIEGKLFLVQILSNNNLTHFIHAVDLRRLEKAYPEELCGSLHGFIELNDLAESPTRKPLENLVLEYLGLELPNITHINSTVNIPTRAYASYSVFCEIQKRLKVSEQGFLEYLQKKVSKFGPYSSQTLWELHETARLKETSDSQQTQSLLSEADILNRLKCTTLEELHQRVLKIILEKKFDISKDIKISDVQFNEVLEVEEIALRPFVIANTSKTATYQLDSIQVTNLGLSEERVFRPLKDFSYPFMLTPSKVVDWTLQCIPPRVGQFEVDISFHFKEFVIRKHVHCHCTETGLMESEKVQQK